MYTCKEDIFMDNQRINIGSYWVKINILRVAIEAVFVVSNTILPLTTCQCIILLILISAIKTTSKHIYVYSFGTSMVVRLINLTGRYYLTGKLSLHARNTHEHSSVSTDWRSWLNARLKWMENMSLLGQNDCD